jgi:hypothetical protein
MIAYFHGEHTEAAGNGRNDSFVRQFDKHIPLMNGIAVARENANNVLILAAMERNGRDWLDSAHDRNRDACRGAFDHLGGKRNVRRRHQAQYESSNFPLD